MIAWGAILTSDQIEQLVDFIEQLPVDEPVPPSETDDEQAGGDTGTEPEPTAEPAQPEISFAANVAPILNNYCVDCHGDDGGWDAETYESVMNTGDNSPVVIPGDVEGSLLAQKITGTHEEGKAMPPSPYPPLKDELIQIILDWIAAGAPDN